MRKPTTNPAVHARFALVAALYRQQLGEVIRKRREFLGLTQKDVAQRANIEEAQTVSRWERGLNQPTDLDAVARALDTTPDELLRELKPITQKERRSLDPHGPTQLDRIEAKLDELLSRLPAGQGPAEVLEEEADRTDEPPARTGAKSTRKPATRRAS